MPSPWEGMYFYPLKLWGNQACSSLHKELAEKKASYLACSDCDYNPSQHLDDTSSRKHFLSCQDECHTHHCIPLPLLRLCFTKYCKYIFPNLHPLDSSLPEDKSSGLFVFLFPVPDIQYMLIKYLCNESRGCWKKELDYLDSDNCLLIIRASHLVILCLSFEQNRVRHSDLYLNVRYCVNGYCFEFCIYFSINPFILTTEAMSSYKIISGSVITFYLILTSSGRAPIMSHVTLSAT